MLLRIVVGWHFLYQGLWKLNNPEFSSDAFLRNSKGPWATEFRKLIPDVDGRQRLAGPDAPFGEWQQIHDGFVAYYTDLTADQKKAAEDALSARKNQWKVYYETNKADIEQYFIALDRWETERQRASSWIDYEQKKLYQKRQDLDGKVKGWLEEEKSISRALKDQLQGLLLENQRNRPLPVPPLSNLDLVNKVVLYSNIAIGVCLIAGLFTWLASFGGLMFLGLIVAASPEWPTYYPPAHPSAGQALIIDKNFVEMTALFVLMCTTPGRWAGLDFFLNYMFFRPRADASVAKPIIARTARK